MNHSKKLFRNRITTKCILAFFFILNTAYISSQTSSNDRDYYNWFDSKLGLENTGLHNGIIYEEIYKTIDGNHKFYLTSQFTKGSIIYDGQAYFDVEMKYDIYEDVLIVKLPSHSAYYIIKLINDKINRFSINNHQFIKKSERNEEFFNETISGFYEIYFQSEHISLFKKHKKSRKERIGESFVYNEFKDDSEYIVSYKNHYYKISSKKDLKTLFPKLKKNINNFYKSNKRLFKSDNDSFMIQLIKHVNSLIIK
jgi:hypothetical protein